MERWISPVPSPTNIKMTSTSIVQTNSPFPTQTRFPFPSEIKEIIDGIEIEMMLIPAGEFIMGSNDGESDEQPVHPVPLTDYYIDKYEVTNLLYSKCVKAGEFVEPYESGLEDIYNYYGNYEYEDYPVVHVTLDMAQLFCEWRGADLPKETEWEKAARGPDEMIYPWGNDFDGSKLNFCDYRCNKENNNKAYDDGYALTSPVGSFPGGASLYGVQDLAGNVWEWVAGKYREKYLFHPQDIFTVSFGYLAAEPKQADIGRGGSWYNTEYELRSAYRADFEWEIEEERHQSAFVGFRCAKPAIPKIILATLFGWW